jgi:hypothetical protein
MLTRKKEYAVKANYLFLLVVKIFLCSLLPAESLKEATSKGI